jgi:hypothetical protein
MLYQPSLSKICSSIKNIAVRDAAAAQLIGPNTKRIVAVKKDMTEISIAYLSASPGTAS